LQHHVQVLAAIKRLADIGPQRGEPRLFPQRLDHGVVLIDGGGRHDDKTVLNPFHFARSDLTLDVTRRQIQSRNLFSSSLGRRNSRQ
jgi:hypothetical protein